MESGLGFLSSHVDVALLVDGFWMGWFAERRWDEKWKERDEEIMMRGGG